MSSFDITVESGGYTYRVEGDWSPIIPAKLNPPDEAHPAEGGIEGINRVRLLTKKGDEVDLPDFLQEALDEKVIEENLLDDEIIEHMEGE